MQTEARMPARCAPALPLLCLAGNLVHPDAHTDVLFVIIQTDRALKEKIIRAFLRRHTTSASAASTVVLLAVLYVAVRPT
jgi:hypothetical protein